MLVSIPYTAIGEDYSPSFPFAIMYSAGGPSEVCTDIMILDDTSLEGFHSFSVEITSTTLNINALALPSLPLSIRIQDDERTFQPFYPIGILIVSCPMYRCICEASSNY